MLHLLVHKPPGPSDIYYLAPPVVFSQFGLTHLVE